MRSVLIVVALLFFAGCSGKSSGVENVPLDKVPENVMKVAKEQLPEVTFDQAWKTHNGNFEIRGKTKTGKVRDVQVTPKGEVVEVD